MSKHAKRWGRVSARPSEYLIKLRNGRIVRHGAGLSVFVWPRDSYAILPTSVQRISFVADQVTAERAGVEVTGITVYRIADPLLAYRMLDFTDEHRGIEQLAEILRDMFIGAARRLVANMTVEQCLSKRKEGIAAELMREIQPVVSGSGRPEDTTDQGWGLVIDTIEIQDVRVLSETVFDELQAPYRAELQLRARTSQLTCEQQVHLKQVETDRSRLEANLQLDRQRQQAEEQSRLQKLARDQRLRLAQLESQQSTAEAEHAFEQHRADQQAALARQRAEQAAALRGYESDAELSLKQRRVEAEARIAEQQAAIDRLQGELRAAIGRQQQEVENLLTDNRIRYEFIRRALPALAEALASCTDRVQVTQISRSGDSAAGGGFLGGTLAELLAVARSAGISLPSVVADGHSERKVGQDERTGKTPTSEVEPRA